MLNAFQLLDKKIPDTTRIIVGGGAALIASYDLSITTQDVDGVPDKTSLEFREIKEAVQKVGRELGISQDWLNDYFSTYLYVLPKDYGDRLQPFYKGKNLEVVILGKEDLLIMKCFAAREKDIPHARVLIRRGADLKKVDQRIQELLEKGIPDARKAADFFDDLCGEMGLTP